MCRRFANPAPSVDVVPGVTTSLAARTVGLTDNPDTDSGTRRGRDPAQTLGETTLARFAAGDPAALGEIFDTYSRPVWVVVVRIVGDGKFADDAVQETFLRAWRSADRFDPARPLGPWLFTLARRTAIDVLRKELRPTRGGHEPETDLSVDLPGIEESWQRWEIVRALDSLPPEERIVVRLSHLDGLTHTEIAEQLSIPVGTVKSRSHRAHRRLAERLAHLSASHGEDAS